MVARTQNEPKRLGIIRGVSERIVFLPEPLRNFIKHRLLEITGLIIIIFDISFAISIIDYNSLDASINNSTSLPVSNIMGLYGAIVSDLALQFFGVSILLPFLILLVWGFHLIRHITITHIGYKILATLISVFTAAFVLSSLSSPIDWPILSGLGGMFGYLTFEPVISFCRAHEIDKGFPIFAAVMISFISFLLALSLDWKNLCSATGALVWATLKSSVTAIWTIKRSGNTTQRITGGLKSKLIRRQSIRQEPKPLITSPSSEKSEKIEPIAPSTAGKNRIAPQTKALKPSKKAQSNRQATLKFSAPGEIYELPPLDLLANIDEGKTENSHISEEALEQNARILESVLEDFGVHGEIVQVRPGPVVTLYELEPAPGTKTNRVIGLADDIARSMSAISVRIAVVPGRNVIGIELPNSIKELVGLRELLASSSFEKKSNSLTLALGKTIGGEPEMANLARMPHLLIAGTTGSGKSVGINAMIASLLYRLEPEECKFIMIDPKMLELSVYDGIPHLLTPVVTDPKKSVVALKWITREMENRYRSMSKLGVRNITGYNQRIEQARKRGEILSRRVQTGFDPESGRPVFEEQPFDMTPLPFIVVIVDEMADLMLVAGKEVEAAVQRLAQMARAAGIHLILATQRPSVDVITGTIKANLPTRISFAVTTKIDSRTILGEPGAEQLLGNGDMLYREGGGKITRVHGPFVSDSEVEALVAFLKSQGEPEYIEDITEDENAANGIPGFEDKTESNNEDELYDQAVALVAREGKASTSFVQRHLQIGYNRAARIIEQMENEGVISSANRVGKREVLVSNHGQIN
ncbi:MAG: DNA translocase FtsK 4TM domain-containing protein [Alphaproteobacteria bacterium]|nr:DNA translocase FtsK 4TM domain-containing protein [Alphaproteobacteria bacterium]